MSFSLLQCVGQAAQKRATDRKKKEVTSLELQRKRKEIERLASQQIDLLTKTVDIFSAGRLYARTASLDTFLAACLAVLTGHSSPHPVRCTVSLASFVSKVANGHLVVAQGSCAAMQFLVPMDAFFDHLRRAGVFILFQAGTLLFRVGQGGGNFFPLRPESEREARGSATWELFLPTMTTLVAKRLVGVSAATRWKEEEHRAPLILQSVGGREISVDFAVLRAVWLDSDMCGLRVLFFCSERTGEGGA
uniref:Uncharacterized protein n=1 Tax=Chromera velia CCMP2878 TaxID=1169474 RepID=A0A0G4HGZ6_9ALVE|eukprot:Cvel_27462.t1-p1 / transcript=Cvel_27462.t1 / gene=Cvel_27462 / organism=Chromera_velia_CCMP2878 / gene_product=hypothetical protein / transcript_product=hypothetical protein / location=Cvel_scaffold3429:4864-5896(-) / protein_length=247 / sequence_SO=supercontig / SO=protein_coding / is_pseudo=false